MNTPNNQNPNSPYGNQYPNNQQNQQGLDKTFIEGANQQPYPPPLQPGVRANTASFPSVNPYTQTGNTGTRTGGRFNAPADTLPSGNEPIPLGSGTVVGLLGSGGMAKVYKIWNEQLEVFRAVKILLPTQQADLKNRFETEAKITVQLRHPNIVEIYNIGEWNGLPFLEMEYIDGFSLDHFISQSGKLPNAVCSAIAILVVRALEYAHSHEFLIYGKKYFGIIHRDLKPSNIMIPKIGDVRLMDFGIARPTEASLHTVEGNIVGTMQYLSPEQMDGIDVDARSDLYSFGAILYEMLTGTKTFPQDTITNLMKKKIMNEYRKFSDFDFQVSTQLAKIAQKCLQLEKTDRYTNASHLLGELESAHRSLCQESPAKVLKRYLNNPEGFKDNTGNGFKLKLSPKVVIPVAGIIGIGSLVAVFIITGPKPEDTEVVTPPPPKDTIVEHVPPKPDTPVIAYVPKDVDIPPPPKFVPNVPDKKPIPPIVKHITTPPTIKQPADGGLVTTTPTTKPPPDQIKISPLEELKKKYNSEDLLAIGKSAIKARNYDDAIFALENIPAGSPDGVTKTLLLFEAYITSGKLGEALVIANNESITDAQFDYLCGRLYEQTNKTKKALECYQTALTKPSVIRSRNEIRNDALYQTAVLWTTQHRANPTPDTRIQALNAWNTVKRTYTEMPDHPRFKKANSELNSIQ